MIDFEAAARLDEKDAARKAAMMQGEINAVKTPPPRQKRSENLNELNLETELVTQYSKVLDLQEEVFADFDIPANQKAQVAGQVASTLQQLIKMQSEFYTAERFKSIEGLMVRYMKKLPLAVAEEFVADYERLSDV